MQGLAAASASGVYGEARAAAAIIGAADLKLGDGVARVLDALQAASPNRSGVYGTTSPGAPTPRSTTGKRQASWPTTPSVPAPACWPAGDCRWTS